MQVGEVNSGAVRRQAREKLRQAARRREIDVVLVRAPAATLRYSVFGISQEIPSSGKFRVLRRGMQPARF
jgi:hypothetical protein